MFIMSSLPCDDVEVGDDLVEVLKNGDISAYFLSITTKDVICRPLLTRDANDLLD